jgi:hypothetical protein
MQYGKESQDALVKLIARKCVTLHVYGQDQFKRFVCDIHCGGVFIQVDTKPYTIVSLVIDFSRTILFGWKRW